MLVMTERFGIVGRKQEKIIMENPVTPSYCNCYYFPRVLVVPKEYQ